MPVFRHKPPDPFAHRRKDLARISYKNPNLLAKFLTPGGQILPTRLTGVRRRTQKKLASEIKKARFLGILSFTGNSVYQKIRNTADLSGLYEHVDEKTGEARVSHDIPSEEIVESGDHLEEDFQKEIVGDLAEKNGLAAEMMGVPSQVESKFVFDTFKDAAYLSEDEVDMSLDDKDDNNVVGSDDEGGSDGSEDDEDPVGDYLANMARGIAPKGTLEWDPPKSISNPRLSRKDYEEGVKGHSDEKREKKKEQLRMWLKENQVLSHAVALKTKQPRTIRQVRAGHQGLRNPLGSFDHTL
ncbi:ribosomal protein mS18 [Acrasis kona]|uniref:Ribosomal protein mS18 n=1 Tax=Acrasis kona TaxID=1008807 RepID=A0AAW2YT84_9EUKA